MKVLLIRFSSIGDIVLTSPVVRGLKQQLGAEVHFLTKKRFAGLMQPNPNVDRVWALGDSLAKMLAVLRRQRYDWVLDLHHNLRSWWVKQVLGRPSRSFYKANLEKWLLVNLGVDVMPERHLVHRYVETAHHLGVRYDGQGLDYFIPLQEEIDLAAWEGPSAPYVAFAIGANHATKRLPLEKMAEVCQHLDLPVVLLGGKDDAERGTWVAREGGSRVFNACGKLTLHQSASVVRQAAVVLTHDTGLMHIAAAFRRPIVSLWGNTVPRFGMYPFYPDGLHLDTILEVEGLSCRPCSKIGYERCPKGHFRCMHDLETLAIAAAVNHRYRETMG